MTCHNPDDLRRPEVAPGESASSVNTSGISKHGRSRAASKRKCFEKMNACILSILAEKKWMGRVAGEDAGPQDWSFCLGVSPRLK